MWKGYSPGPSGKGLEYGKTTDGTGETLPMKQ